MSADHGTTCQHAAPVLGTVRGVQRPTPVPDELTAFHWEAAARGELRVQTCQACGGRQYPPTTSCLACLSDDLGDSAVSGQGSVYSFTVVRQAFDRGFVDDIPYVVALVELAEDPTVRLLTNLVGIAPDQVTVGMAVEVSFEQVGAQSLPVFQPC